MLTRPITFIFLVLFCCFSTTVFAYNNLIVLDPQEPWWSESPGTIEEAAIHVKPQGIYTQVELYLTMSARGTYLHELDNMEIVLDFDLPKDALVIDSWLWFQGEIIIADLIDRWSATNIYESYVNRQTDPSLLLKNSPTQYQLRVFPLMMEDSRKVKITYLVPTDWSMTTIRSILPSNILKTSYNPIEDVTLRIYDTPNWANAHIPELDHMTFESGSDSSGSFQMLSMSGENLPNSLSLVCDSPMDESGVYVENYETDEGEGVYQMVALPNHNFEVDKGKDVVFLFDYDSGNSLIEKEEILASLAAFLKSTLNEKDRFNLIFSRASINRLSEDWVNGDAASIDELLLEIQADTWANFSNLPSLLSNGIDFVNTVDIEEKDVAMILIANSGLHGEEEIAEAIVAELQMQMKRNVSINIADFQRYNGEWHSINNIWYKGNEYLYRLLAQKTNGNYNQYTYYTLESILPEIMDLANFYEPTFSTLEVHTDVANGFCHSRYLIGNKNIHPYLNQPIYQVGRYVGEFPFEVEINGIYEGEVYHFSKTIAMTALGTSTAIADKIWKGVRLMDWEKSVASNAETTTLINQSMEDRVLTRYTAFLCVEPEDDDTVDEEDGGGLWDNEGDEIITVATDEVDSVSTAKPDIQVFPNPFVTTTSIQIKLPEGLSATEVELQIFDVLGQQVKHFNPQLVNEAITIEWNAAADDLPTGIYLIRIRIGERVYTQKVQLLARA